MIFQAKQKQKTDFDLRRRFVVKAYNFYVATNELCKISVLRIRIHGRY